MGAEHGVPDGVDQTGRRHFHDRRAAQLEEVRGTPLVGDDEHLQIRVIGEAAKPQVLSYRKGLTLLDVMIAVGGLTPFADGNRATISRGAEGGKSYSVRLRDLVTRGEIAANVEMVIRISTGRGR